MKLARRRFIQAGIAGTALLVSVRWIDRGLNTWAASPDALDAGANEVIRALVPVVLAGALPADAARRAKAVDETVEAFGRAVGGLAPAIQEEIGQMLSLLSFTPTRFMMTGVGAGWRDASPSDIAAFLEDWRHSRFDLKRAGYRALTLLIQGSWFDNPLAWPVIGYPGPPELPA